MGLDLGLEEAGFEVVVALECDRHAAETIRDNRPELPLIENRLENVSTLEILQAARLKPGGNFIVSGGPSCQAFSTAGRRESLGDLKGRGGLFMEFIRVVREARPRFFVMENVRGLLSAAIKHRPLIDRGPGCLPLEAEEELGTALTLVTSELKALGYFVTFDLLNSADYGVPQTRQRLVFIGSRDGENIQIPKPSHDVEGRDGLAKWVTLRQALKGLKEIDPIFYSFSPSKERFLKLVPEGGNWRDLPEDLRQEALGKAFVSWGGRSGFYRRLNWDKPSPALTTRPDSKATILCHPVELRPLTVGEYARIQQFPIIWRFSGTVREQYKQVGNAVPIGLGKAIGLSIMAAIRSRVRKAKQGHVECSNLRLLQNLSKTPVTRLNPPRMRKERSKEAVTEWFEGRIRERTHAFDDYAPKEVLEKAAGKR
jgi:DNA (cytosine-5)-methyltransferase 1